MDAPRAIDADGHIMEDEVDWARRLPGAFRERAPTIVRDERGVIQVVLDGWLMYARHYAHWDCEFPDSARKLADHPALTARQKARLLRENALRFYGLPVTVQP